jgi:Xaa-Pro aminopeptidase
MQGPANESVGTGFSDELLQAARDKTLAVIREAASQTRPGMSENEVKQLIARIQTQIGAPTSWHPPQIRFGRNTLLPFGKKDVENPILQDNDIFFFDIGPIFDGHEGDVGRTFSVGSDPEMAKCARDCEEIWNDVRTKWASSGVNGAELYAFAAECARQRGWELALEKANGHRIADFPHAARGRGSVEGFESHHAPNRWILEIQIRHPLKPFGAFFEDLLN